MKKILLIIALLTICAALEVPEDYEPVQNRPYIAKINAAENHYTAAAGIPGAIHVPEVTVPL